MQTPENSGIVICCLPACFHMFSLLYLTYTHFGVYLDICLLSAWTWEYNWRHGIIFYDEEEYYTNNSCGIVFNSSHYWGGQLEQIAAKEGITRSMKQNCESR